MNNLEKLQERITLLEETIKRQFADEVYEEGYLQALKDIKHVVAELQGPAHNSVEFWKSNFNIIADYMEACPSQRLGQAIFNNMSGNFQSAEDLRATPVDCFHRDELIIPFFEAFLKAEGEEPVFPYQAWNESKLAKHFLKYDESSKNCSDSTETEKE